MPEPHSPSSATTGWQITIETTVSAVLARLSSVRLANLGKVCHIYCAGGQPKSIFDQLAADPRVRVLFTESLLPRGLRFLPSWRGLVRIDDSSVLAETFEALSAQTMATVLIFDTNLEQKVVESVAELGEPRDEAFGIKADPGYLLYIVDCDRDDTSSGMTQLLSCGNEGPWRDLLGDLSDAVSR